MKPVLTLLTFAIVAFFNVTLHAELKFEFDKGPDDILGAIVGNTTGGPTTVEHVKDFIKKTDELQNNINSPIEITLKDKNIKIKATLTFIAAGSELNAPVVEFLDTMTGNFLPFRVINSLNIEKEWDMQNVFGYFMDKITVYKHISQLKIYKIIANNTPEFKKSPLQELARLMILEKNNKLKENNFLGQKHDDVIVNAIIFRNLDIVRHFSSKFSSYNLRLLSMNVLSFVITKGDNDLFQELIKPSYKLKLDDHKLCEASYYLSTASLKLLLKKNLNPNAKCGFTMHPLATVGNDNIFDPNFYSALEYAVLGNKVNNVKLLLNHSATTLQTKQQAKIIAEREGNADIIKLFENIDSEKDLGTLGTLMSTLSSLKLKLKKLAQKLEGLEKTS